MNRKHGMKCHRYRYAAPGGRLQTQAGLKRSGRLAAPSAGNFAAGATTQLWRTVILDLDGDNFGGSSMEAMVLAAANETCFRSAA